MILKERLKAAGAGAGRMGASPELEDSEDPEYDDEIEIKIKE